MMKIILLVVLLAVAVQKSYAGGEEFMKRLAECKTSEKATDADFMNIKNKVKPATKEMKCLKTCLAEKMGLINTNQISADGITKLVKSLPNTNDNMVKGAAEIVDECKGIQDPDRCEFGAKATDCLVEESSKRSLKLFMH